MARANAAVTKKRREMADKAISLSELTVKEICSKLEKKIDAASIEQLKGCSC